MIATRLIPRAELEKKLRLYSCKKVADADHGVELWETGWGVPFTLKPIPHADVFDEWQLRQVLGSVIARTLPPDWHEKNGD
jgi:hypothetical protein